MEEEMENFNLVERAYNELINSGEIYSTSDPQSVENQKAYLTRRAAYYLNQIDNNLGLLSKTTGNNVMGLSTDIVIKRNGDYYDIATDFAGLVRPVNSDIVSDPSLASRWIQPTKELAGLTNIPPVVPPVIPPIVPPIVLPDDYQKFLNILTTLANNQIEILDLINTNQLEIMSKLNEINSKPLTVTFPDYKSSGWLTVILHPVAK